MTHRGRFLGKALLCFLAATGGLAVTGRVAAQGPAGEPGPPVRVVCVGAAGKPVAGAKVYLFQNTGGENSRYRSFGPFETDAEGRASCDEAVFRNAEGSFDRFVYARLPGRLVGVARSANWSGRGVINPELRVSMQPSRTLEGNVTVPRAFDPMRVTVRIQTLHVITGDGSFDYQSLPRSDVFPGLDTALPEIFERRPDAEGRIRFEDLPVRGRVYLLTRSDGLGEAQWRNDGNEIGKPIELKIERESLVFGRVLLPDGRPAAGMRVAARLTSQGRRKNVYLTTFRAATTKEGKFAIRGLPQTEFVLSIEDPRGNFAFRPRENLFIPVDDAEQLTLKMETGILVRGRVFDPDGKPVEGAAFSALADTKIAPGLCHDSTDADGRYQFRLPAGNAKLYFNSLPDGFAYPKPQIVKQLVLNAGQADIDDLDFTLRRKPEGNDR